MRAPQPSGTNRPSSCSSDVPRGGRTCGIVVGESRCAALRARSLAGNARRWSATMAGEAHPVPSRTRKLSPRAPMVLRGQPVGEQDVADQRRAFPHRGPPPARRGRGASRVARGARGPVWRFRGAADSGPRGPGWGVYLLLARRHARSAANLENRILRSMRSTRKTSEIASPRRDRGAKEAPDVA